VSCVCKWAKSVCLSVSRLLGVMPHNRRRLVFWRRRWRSLADSRTFKKYIFGPMPPFIFFFGTQTMHIESTVHNSTDMICLKTLCPGGIWTRVFCSRGWGDVHCGTPPPGQGTVEHSNIFRTIFLQASNRKLWHRRSVAWSTGDHPVRVPPGCNVAGKDLNIRKFLSVAWVTLYENKCRKYFLIRD
jgi:hypothetical protein